MKINNFFYLIKEGVRSVFRHSFMSFAAVFVTVACLLIIGSFVALTYNLGLIVQDLNQTHTVMVYVDETLSDDEARSVGTDINMLNNIERAEYISREDAMEKYAQQYSDTGVFEGVDVATFRHRFQVYMEENRLLEQTKKDIMNVPGVVKIRAAEEVARIFITVEDVLQMLSTAITVALLFVCLMIISNTVKLAMASRRDEIAIMKMVGATNGFIRLPFVVQGFLLGIVGAGIAFGLEWLVYNGLVTKLAQMGAGELLEMEPFTQLLPIMITLFAGAGMFVGLVGSFSSIRKYMRQA